MRPLRSRLPKLRWILLCCLFLGTTAYADSPTQEQTYQLGIYYYDVAEGTCDTTSNTATAAPAIGFDTQAAQTVVDSAAKSGVTVGYALYKSTGEIVANNNPNYIKQNYGASITKAMLLVAYLNMVGTGKISPTAQSELTKMIEDSDNTAANWVYNSLSTQESVRETDVTTVASRAGMSGFKLDVSDPVYILGQSLVTANDFAQFFSKIFTLVPSGQVSFAQNLLSNLSPADQVGLLKAGLPGTVYSKEGWKTEGTTWVVNQAAQFTANGTPYGIAVTTSGAATQQQAEGIIKDLASALISGGGSTTTTGGATGGTTGGTAVSGSISSRAGQGMSASAQQKFQQYAVAAGQKNGVDPDLVASFYYVERGHTGDSTNNADAANGTAATGDGKWEDPAPPIGTGPAYVTNSLGYAEPYGLSQTDKVAYGEDGDGDGQINMTDLGDAMFTAANFLVKAAHASANMSDKEIFATAMVYNNSTSYAQSIVNIMHYLKTGSTTSVSGSGSSGSCGSSGGGNASCASAASTTGDAKILAEAECWNGVYYEWSGGHQGFANFKQGCPDPTKAPNNQPHGGAINGDPGGQSGNPSPCAVDCSGLVSMALDFAFNRTDEWIVGLGTPGSQGITGMAGSGADDAYWKSIPISQAQAGDIVTVPNDHVEIVVSVNSASQSVTTFGAHDTGVADSIVNSSFSYWPGGAWHWTGPGSQ